jgi:molybdate transport system substrate-binding protein
MKKTVLCVLALSIVLFVYPSVVHTAQKRITVFCGSASKPAMEDAVSAFEQRSGIKVDLNFGGSGTMLSQMKIARRGDVYIPGSPDFLLIAEKQGIIDPASARIIAYLVPAINVQPGNPKNIRTLIDLSKPGVRVGIGNPEAVCVGLYAIELLERNRLLEQVQKNIVTHAPSCEATEALVALKKVDAVIGWDVFSHWNPGKIETILLRPDEIPRLAYIPAAVSTYARDKTEAQKFVAFVASAESRAIFVRRGYATAETEVRKYAPHALIGGEYQLPANFTSK